MSVGKMSRQMSDTQVGRLYRKFGLKTDQVYNAASRHQYMKNVNKKLSYR